MLYLEVNMEDHEEEITFPPKDVVIIKTEVLEQLRKEGLEFRRQIDAIIKDTVKWG